MWVCVRVSVCVCFCPLICVLKQVGVSYNDQNYNRFIYLNVTGMTVHRCLIILPGLCQSHDGESFKCS